MIVFSGLDCSGKSTQIAILRNKVSSKKKKPYVFWSRGGYTPGIQMLKDLFRKVGGKKLPKPGKTKKREEAFSRPIVRKIWLFLALLDLIYFYAIFLRFKELFGYSVICDRYILDTSIDFKLNFPQENVENWLTWKFLNFVALVPKHTFVSLIPVEVSVLRSKDKFEPFPDSPEVLQKRLEYYTNALSKNKKLIYIDGLKSIKEVTSKVDSYIKI